MDLTDKDARFAIEAAEKILIFIKAMILKVQGKWMAKYII